MFYIVLSDLQETEQEIDDEVDILMSSNITLFCLFYIVLFDFQETEQEIDDEVDILMSSDIVAAQMSTKNITFTRAQKGWLFRQDKSVSL